ncbi:hypothetical protein L917_14829 [Phytophthora nicotianae]|uniref:Uncharacterized protein n=1 Tax=Phytophthora nicotianae TaxID=4792 RepID=W2KMW6_PHYNI|nr:hypothetical protein L917_14829 [Phytophthora nicotianae]
MATWSWRARCLNLSTRSCRADKLGAVCVDCVVREHYLGKIRRRCAVTGERFEAVVSTVKGVKPEVMKIIAAYVLKRPAEVISDNDVLQLVHGRCNSLKNAYVPDVKSLFKKTLRMDLSIDDCDSRICRYFQDFVKVVEDNGLQQLIGKTDTSLPGYRDRMKARCKLLMDNLQRAVLREQIERLVDLDRRDCRTDDVALFDLILEHAKAQYRYHRLNKENAPAVATSRSAKNQVSQSQKQPATTTGRGTKPGALTGTRPAKTAKPPVDGCLVCGGAHWLKECLTATEEQRREALDKFRTAKEQRVRSKAAKGTGSLKTVIINNLVVVVYLPDSGADRSIIPSCVVETLRTVQPDLDV